MITTQHTFSLIMSTIQALALHRVFVFWVVFLFAVWFIIYFISGRR